MDNLAPASKNKMIGFLGKADAIGRVEVEIDDVTRGKRPGFPGSKESEVFLSKQP